MLVSFLFLHENVCCGYSLEAPRRGASNEYPQHMFPWRNKKNIMCIPPLICSYVEVPQVCTLALNNLPTVGLLIWCLTERWHIVKLEITWQLPRTQASRQINQPSKTKKQSAVGVTGGMTKMAEKNMAAPTLTSMEDELNVAVCSTPSTPQDSMASTEEPSTQSPANTKTDHSPEGEWKEVVSKKKKLSMSPRKPASPAKMKEDFSMGLGRKILLPPPKKPRVRLPLQEPGREKLIAAKGRE